MTHLAGLPQVRFVDYEAHPLLVIFRNIAEDGEPHDIIVRLTSALQILQRQGKILIYDFVVLGVYLGEDMVVVVFCVEFRRHDTESKRISAFRTIVGLISESKLEKARFVDK